jgi:hypothetical protein
VAKRIHFSAIWSTLASVTPVWQSLPLVVRPIKSYQVLSSPINRCTVAMQGVTDNRVSSSSLLSIGCDLWMAVTWWPALFASLVQRMRMEDSWRIQQRTASVVACSCSWLHSRIFLL